MRVCVLLCSCLRSFVSMSSVVVGCCTSHFGAARRSGLESADHRSGAGGLLQADEVARGDLGHGAEEYGRHPAGETSRSGEGDQAHRWLHTDDALRIRPGIGHRSRRRAQCRATACQEHGEGKTDPFPSVGAQGTRRGNVSGTAPGCRRALRRNIHPATMPRPIRFAQGCRLRSPPARG